MMTPMRHHPVRSPKSRTGFGFDAMMERPEYGRFERWYADANRLGPSRVRG